MTQNYPKRLIEVDLPIKRISAHARREKSIRHGHISTLHIWWARRPLAACRAVICAALWPDPADQLCPASFRGKVRAEMLAWTPHERQKLLSEDSRKRFEAARQKPALFDQPEQLRGALLDFIADFANWDNSTVREYLDTSRALTQAAHEALGGAPGTRPLVVDPFAGGGSIPLEALRVGADAYASDLNPVAVLLNKVVLEYIPKYGQRLADEVRKWGDWIKRAAEKELAEFYPKDADGATPIAYLWARTILSEGPDEDNAPVEVPLISSLWLAKDAGTNYALRWIRNGNGHVQTELVKVKYADGMTRSVRRPLLEIFEPKKVSEVENGTVARGSATCPLTGYTTPVARIREQLARRCGGTKDARLIAVRKTNMATGKRTYRPVSDGDRGAAEAAAEELERRKAEHKGALSLVPDEALPPQGTLGFRVQRYGIKEWGALFTPRQALSLTTLGRLVREVATRLAQENDKDCALAVETCLAMAVDRLADFNSSLCRLNKTGGRGVVNTFGRQALPMMWDFLETNPFNDVGANWLAGVEAFASTAEKEVQNNSVRLVESASAMNHPLPNDIAQALITDPPYYDAVPFADLSDFFLVWLRRVLGYKYDSLLSEPLSPKEDECIVDPVKGKDKVYFERAITRAMTEGRRVVAPTGIGVILFAHKSTAGWEALLQALVDAGWVITGSWPIDTERPGRLRAQDSAALASSIHLVCRPRENPDGSVRTDEIGDWRDVLQELPRRIHEWMPRLDEEGVSGADAIFACLGPALEIFSRYSRVEKASGQTVTLKEYLEHVWAAVAKEALTLVFEDADATGFEPDARLTAMWLWTLKSNTNGSNGAEEPDEEDDDSKGETKKSKAGGFALEYDAARKIAQGLGAHLEDLDSLVEVSGETARLLPVAERARHLFGKEEGKVAAKRKKREPQMSLFKVLEEAGEEESSFGEVKASRLGDTVLDRVHQSMILFAAGRGEALRRFLIDDGVGNDQRFWGLANALAMLYPKNVEEKRWVEGVMARKKGLGF